MLVTPFSHLTENSGSTARDFCMLERNILSHIKLALLLSLLSTSVLLQARLVPDTTPKSTASQIPFASVQFGAAILSIIAGAWEYYCGYRDLRNARGFLASVKPHMIIMGCLAGIVFGTCIVLLVQE